MGSPYLILSDGAAALELEGQYILFLAEDTVEYEGIYKKKNQVSEDTLEWLNFYYSLTAQERLALSMIPSEFVIRSPDSCYRVRRRNLIFFRNYFLPGGPHRRRACTDRSPGHALFYRRGSFL